MRIARAWSRGVRWGVAVERASTGRARRLGRRAQVAGTQTTGLARGWHGVGVGTGLPAAGPRKRREASCSLTFRAPDLGGRTRPHPLAAYPQTFVPAGGRPAYGAPASGRRWGTQTSGSAGARGPFEEGGGHAAAPALFVAPAGQPQTVSAPACILRAGMKRAHEMAGSTHAFVRCKSNQMQLHSLSCVGMSVPVESVVVLASIATPGSDPAPLVPKDH